ncbi:beta-3-deoxy-D-manno-oct-2-ulosonic acid transferase [Sphingomonas humi]|uniref:capsular polysaccharide export protein, LipB/KpsS family n=1 Tax=Sphingomonas humi TaxID=335630 RepID=UPI0031D5C35F
MIRHPLPFLPLPPFPKRKIDRFELDAHDAPALGDTELDALIEQLAAARVGGTWWGAQPDPGAGGYVLVRRSALAQDDSNQAGTIEWPDGMTCDPWHLLAGARELRCAPDDPVLLIAGLAGVPVRSDESAARPIERPRLRSLLREALGPRLYRDPFTGAPLPWPELVALCADWRRLVDSNRLIAAVYGFAGWKRATTEPLLWDGSDNDRFNRPPATLKAGDKAAVWRSRTSPQQLAAIEQAGAILVEVEDGFIRSAGLGANCVPPQSIVVDEVGVHFDARSPSGLERILEDGPFDPALIARAKALRQRIVALGLSKYDRGEERLERRSAGLHVLVPGQVEDDRAVLSSIGEPLTNLELLRRVRAARPQAHIVYKPHPDVEAGHRKGAIQDANALHYADEVVRAPSISSWITLVNEVHVNSSLAGFEALLRDRRVATHGVPFYAGWGLTEDLGPVPARRTARRSLDELVAATLIVYPRYVDPVTNLPCSPEVLIEQLSVLTPADLNGRSPLTLARRLQGRLRRLVAPLGRGR